MVNDRNNYIATVATPLKLLQILNISNYQMFISLM